MATGERFGKKKLIPFSVELLIYKNLGRVAIISKVRTGIILSIYESN